MKTKGKTMNNMEDLVRRYFDTITSVMTVKSKMAHDSVNSMEDDYDSYNAGYLEGVAVGLNEAVRTLKASEFLIKSTN